MQNYFNALKIETYDMIGSYSDKARHFYGDIDLEEQITISREKFLQILQKKISNIQRNNKIFFMDFKCGFSGSPIKWTYDEIINGQRELNGRQIKLIDFLYTNSIIKLDVIVMDNKKILIPISINYYFDNNKRTMSLKMKDDLKIEAESLYNNDKYKYLKRLYLYYRLTKNKKKLDIVLNLLNSDMGKIGTILNILENIILLLKSNNTGYSIYDIVDNIQYYKKKLPFEVSHILLPAIHSKNKEQMLKHLERSVQFIKEYINNNLNI